MVFYEIFYQLLCTVLAHQQIEAHADNAGTISNLLLGDYQRRRDAESRIAEEEPITHNASLGKEFHHPEHPLRRAELDSQQQSATTNLLHRRVVSKQRFVEDSLSLNLLDNLILFEVVESGQTRSTTYGVTTKGGDVSEYWVVSQRVHHLAACSK